MLAAFAALPSMDVSSTKFELGCKRTQPVGRLVMCRLPSNDTALLKDEGGVTLKLPALTALQLYYDGVLSANGRKSVLRNRLDRGTMRVDPTHF
jgi:hypothetical protein